MDAYEECFLKRFTTVSQDTGSTMCAFCYTRFQSHTSIFKIKEHVKTCGAIPAESISSLETYKEASLYLSLEERIHISEVLKEEYLQKNYPDIDTLFENMKTISGKNLYRAEFIKAMSNVGYHLVKSEAGNIIVEDPKIRFERYNYIKKIMTARQKGKHIYYIDEMGFQVSNNSLLMRRPSVATSISDEILNPKMFYACSTSGCTNTLFCFCLAKAGYLKWMAHSLIPTLKPGSVVVIDNDLLCRTTDSSWITKYHSKSDMIQWLRNNNIPCHSSMHKAELFDLIEKCPFNTGNKLTHIFKASGHELVYLPCHLQQLTISYLMMKTVGKALRISLKASHFTDKNTIGLMIKSKITEAINNIPQTMWADFDTTLQNLEREFMDIDRDMDDILDSNYKLTTNTDSSMACNLCSGHENHIRIFLS